MLRNFFQVFSAEIPFFDIPHPKRNAIRLVCDILPVVVVAVVTMRFSCASRQILRAGWNVSIQPKPNMIK